MASRVEKLMGELQDSWKSEFGPDKSTTRHASGLANFAEDCEVFEKANGPLKQTEKTGSSASSSEREQVVRRVLLD